MSSAIEGLLLASSEAIRVVVSDGRIESIEPIVSDDPLPWIAPGLVDLQVNGYAGIDFNTLPLSSAAVCEATKRLLTQGVTSYFPTIITNSPESISAGLTAIAKACREDETAASCIPGIHLEGPFLSPEDGARGAHDAQHIRAPDWELFRRWQDDAEGRIRLLTLSPEWEGAPEFIARCAGEGVIVSIGHTAAAPEQIREAVAAGARMSTHLGNGAQLMLPRHPNFIWEQLAADELIACVIADGFHLPASVLKVFMRAKAGRMALVSDAVYLSGLEPGTYKTHIGGEVVLTPEGRLHLASNSKILAGSAQMLIEGITYLVRENICTLDEAWTMASTKPAMFAGLAGAGRLEAGAAADLVLFRQKGSRYMIETVYKQGRCMFDQNGIGPNGSA